MAKRIRFQLEMPDGEKVRDLESLQDHFDLETVLAYYNNGKLLTWLRDRYLEDEASGIESLSSDDPDFQKQLCKILGVEYEKSVDNEAVIRRQERIEHLRKFTDRKEHIDHIDQVAFDQDELYDLLDDGVTTIYLCGEKYTIPAAKKGITYIGIKEPNVHLSGKVPGDLDDLEIKLIDVKCDNLPTPLSEISPADNAPSSANPTPRMTSLNNEDGSTLGDFYEAMFKEENTKTNSAQSVENCTPKQIYEDSDDAFSKLEDLLYSDGFAYFYISKWGFISLSDLKKGIDKEYVFAGYSSERECRRVAQRLIGQVVCNANEAIEKYSNMSGKDSSYESVVVQFEKKSNSIQSLLDSLKGLNGDSVIEEMEAIIRDGKALDEIRCRNDSLAREHQLDESDYYYDIEYNSSDSGGFFGAGKRYGYIISSAISKISKAWSKMIKSYFDELEEVTNECFEEHFLEPLQSLLIDLEEALSEDDN